MNLHEALIASAFSNAAGMKHQPLATGTDLNTLVKPGMYRSDTKANTVTLLNVPSAATGHGFALEVFTSANYPSVVQRLTWGSYNVHVPHCVIRCGRPINGTMTWGYWYEFNTTVLTETAAASLAADDNAPTAGDFTAEQPSAEA